MVNLKSITIVLTSFCYILTFLHLHQRYKIIKVGKTLPVQATNSSTSISAPHLKIHISILTTLIMISMHQLIA
jgi:hypothetical protein